MRSQGQFGANYSVNGHRTSGERRVDFNKGYSFLFERCFEENTLEEIEKIDWSHVTVKTLDANYPPCSLPEGYSFVVKDIQYIKCYDSFEVTIEVDKQYWGDVTPYQAQIDGLTASAAEKDSKLAAKDAELAQKESEITALQQDNQTSSAVTMALVGVQISPARAAELRPVIEAAAVSLSDTEAAKSPELITRWDAHLGETVKAGDRRSHEDATGVLRVYKCRQGHTTQADWAPHLTPAMWAVIDVEHAGTMDDPIPAATGMEYEYGKYYLDPNDGKTYLCERTGSQAGDKIVLQYLPHDLVGQYFVLAE